MTGSQHQQGQGATERGGAAVPQRKKKRRMMARRKRTLDPSMIIDYKLPDILRRFITDRGKIIPRRISGATQAQQRAITLSVKRARFLAFLPSAVTHESEKGFAGEMQTAAQSHSSTSFRSSRPSRFGEGGGGVQTRSEGGGGSFITRSNTEVRSASPEGQETPRFVKPNVTIAPKKTES